MKTTKQRFKPWSKEEKEGLTHTLLQMEVAQLESEQKEFQLKEASSSVDADVEYNLQKARMALRAAQLNLNSLEFDKINNISKKKTRFELKEASKESKRHRQNVKVLKEQIERGKPILEEKMSEEPIIEKTPEEKEQESKKEPESGEPEKSAEAPEGKDSPD